MGSFNEKPSEVFSIFQKFCAEINNQLGVSRYYALIMPRSTYPFASFMSSLRITYQTSCTYNPLQNRVAECKNRHLIETAHTLCNLMEEELILFQLKSNL